MNKFKIYQSLLHTKLFLRHLLFPICHLYLFVLIWPVALLYADDAIQLTSDRQFEYANFLFEKKDYAASTIEFKPDDLRSKAEEGFLLMSQGKTEEATGAVPGKRFIRQADGVAHRAPE